MRRLLSRHGVRWALGLLIILTVFAQQRGLLPSTLLDRVDLFVYDMRMKVQPHARDDRIVIVDIDSRSIAEVGRWPWSRNVIAELTTQLTEYYRVSAVGFDVLFTEADTSSGYETLEALANGELKNVDGFRQRLRALKPQLDYDGKLAKALEDKPVVLAYYLLDGNKKGVLPAPAFSTSSFADGRVIDALTWKGYEASIPVLQHAAKAGGYMNTELDPDGLLRSVPLMARVGDAYYESLALATARVAMGASAIRPVFISSDLQSKEAQRQYGIIEAIRMNTKPRQTRIPVEDQIKTLINFRGRGGPDGGGFRYVSAVDVLKRKLKQEELDQRIILVGTTAAGLNDLRATPVNEEYPGVEAHANVIASILDGDFKKHPDFTPAFDAIQLVLVGLLLVFVLPVLTPLYAILFSLATAIAVGYLNVWFYQSLNWVMPVAGTLLLVASLFIFNLAWGYLFEYRKGRAMVNLFGEYVAPELVAEMAANPESYNMEGESRELTVLFCDVRGFTTISEGLDPNELREYINIYLTAMSEDIRGNRGTLDKYIGDAVMAFWGAPVTLPDHASRAVASALLMQQTAAKLNADFMARNWPPLKIGVGLNTGEMRVGDMGSKIRRAYTVMGDAVNLGSRLEGITKVYGVGIAVGDATRVAAPEFAYRELDRVRVKGKNEPVPIFEPLGLQAEIDENRRAALVQWHAALGLVRAQQWEAAERALQALHAAHPDDKLYLLYLERVAHLRASPPGPDWDGVTNFDTK